MRKITFALMESERTEGSTMDERVYIDAELAKDAICGCYITDDEKLMLIRRINRIPAADVVEVRHGRWINGRCSECGEHAPFWAMAATYHLSKYCHGCGAKMDGGQDDGD